jgi:hypothetical protein
MTTDPEVRVSYGVKELLGRIDNRLESIDSKLDSKADLRDVIDLKDRLTKIEKRWEERMAIEAAQDQSSAATFTRREKFVGLFIAAGAVVMQPLLQHFHLGG